jgi:hypothetical protein
MSRTALLAAFELDDAKLDAFRRGELPAAIAERARKATRDDAIFMTGLAIVLAGVLWPILGYFVRDGRLFRDASSGSDLIGLVALVLIAGVLPATALAWAAWTWIIHRRTTARVEQVEGIVRLTAHRQRGMVVFHEISLADRHFAVTPRAFAALADGMNARVFYVPVGDVVVGIEPVD